MTDRDIATLFIASVLIAALIWRAISAGRQS